MIRDADRADVAVHLDPLVVLAVLEAHRARAERPERRARPGEAASEGQHLRRLVGGCSELEVRRWSRAGWLRAVPPQLQAARQGIRSGICCSHISRQGLNSPTNSAPLPRSSSEQHPSPASRTACGARRGATHRRARTAVLSRQTIICSLLQLLGGGAAHAQFSTGHPRL